MAKPRGKSDRSPTEGRPLSTIRRLRTTKRNQIDRVIPDVEALSPESPQLSDGRTPDQIMHFIVNLFDEIQGHDEQIYDHPDLAENAIDEEVENAEAYNEKVRVIIAKLATIGRRLEQSTFYTPNACRVRFNEPSATPMDSGRRPLFESTQVNTPAPTSFATQSSMPRSLDISPEIFDGDRLKFRQFITQFRCFMDRSPGASPMERLMVLRKYLTGEPKSLVSSLELTDANYEVALDMLESNYARVETEKQRILAELRNLPRIPNANDVVSLRRLTTTVQSHVKTLAAMGIPLSALALSLKSSLDAALPMRLRQDFKLEQRMEERFAALDVKAEPSTSRQQQQNNSGGAEALISNAPVTDETAREVERLLKFLRQYIIDREDAVHLNDATNLNQEKGSENRSTRLSKGSKHISATVGGILKRAKQAKAARRPCIFCNTVEHASSRCSSGLSIEKRRELLTRLKRCHRCFRSEHSNPSECGGPRMPCSICGSSEHYASMHTAGADPKSLQLTAAANAVVAGAADSTAVLVLTLSAFIINSRRKLPIRVFIDPGSTLTFISPTARQEFLSNERPVQRARLNVQAFSSEHSFDSDRFAIRLSGAHGDEVVELLAYEYDFAVSPSNEKPSHVTEAIRRFDKTHPIGDRSLLGEWPSRPPSVLIGMDQVYKILRLRAPKIVTGKLTAQETVFGWVVSGPTSAGNVVAAVAEIRDACCVAALSRPAEDIQKLWELEAVGDPRPQAAASTRSADEESAVQQFNDGLHYDGSQYTVSLPKKASIVNLPNNKMVAIERLEKKIHQLRKDSAMYQRYDQEIMKFVQEGHACKVADFVPTSSNDIDETYYMPHHAVITPTDAGLKWRVVFDCSAKSKGATSLNDHLLPGPNLNPDLVTLLINFRLHPTVVSADITRAYMQIRVSPADSKLFRFLWRAPGERVITCLEMQKVTWGASPSGFILAATIREHFRRIDPSAEQELATCLYADDFIKSFETEEEALRFIERFQAILNSANMSLAKWKTNSETIAKYLMANGNKLPCQEAGPSNVFKVLGVSWAAAEDTFRFSIRDMKERAQKHARPTKRLVLSFVASIYDPLGLLIPFTLRGKRLIQRLWSTDLEWNQLIPEDAHSELTDWMAETAAFDEFTIPRRYAAKSGKPIAYRLHVFGDASQSAYASAAYIEYRYPDGTSSSALVMAKSRLAPRDPPSLPRLELLAALMAVRVKVFLSERLNINFEKICLYTDSMITYHWATSASPGKWKTFVANRVNEIQKDSDIAEWFFVPGEQNPADLATRGITARSLTTTKLWWQAPCWLGLPRDQQPVSQPSKVLVRLDPVAEEARSTACPVIAVTPTIDLNRYSTLDRACRVVGLLLRIPYLIPSRKQEAPSTAVLTKEAETKIIRWAQEAYFSKELEATRNNERVQSSSKLAAFNLFLDENQLLRARTRLTEGPMFTYDEKNPIVIPGETRLAKLLILRAHRTNAHFGVTTVLSQLRRRFWITRARQQIKAVLKQCVTCRRRHAAPAQQIEATLPKERTTLIVPFATTGIDFCGPFFVRTREGTQKAYIALFTCGATRGVHLELVQSMDTPHTHLAIRRFLSLYPGCKLFISDNGRSFVKAATDIKRVFNTLQGKNVLEVLNGRQVCWKFICPRSPWRGGFYERLVGTVKNALAKTLGKSLVSFEELRTIISELAAVVNERPITYVSTDADAPTPLTPAHFIRGGPTATALASAVALDKLGPNGEVNASALRGEHAMRTEYFKHLSIRWYRDYILQLRTANTRGGVESKPIAIGDVCLLKEDNLPRIRWELVRVIEAHEGRDGNVRTYTIRLANGNVTKRASQLLVPLEVASDN